MSEEKRLFASEIHEEEEDNQRRENHGGRFELKSEEEKEECPEVGDEKQRGVDEEEEEGKGEEGGDEEDEFDEKDEEMKCGEGEEEGEANREDDNDDEEEQKESKERSLSSTSKDDEPEYIGVDLTVIRKGLECPICLGIIRKTRTVMECLHRFCRECIDKAMRMGNNECPACRTHVASRRSLRDDLNFDRIINLLIPEIDKFEEEELAFHEEEKSRNKQIQASIAQISQKQSEALVKRRSLGKETAIMSRARRSGSGSRRRQNCRNMELNTSQAHDNDDDDGNDNNDDNVRVNGSISDERGTEVRQGKRRYRSGNCSTHPSYNNNNNNNNNCNDKDVEMVKERKGVSSGLVWNQEILAWGKAGVRSSTRHGGGNNGLAGCSKAARNARVTKLVEHLRSLCSNNVEAINFELVSLDAKSTPNVRQRYLCCPPTLRVKQLREFVALQTHLKIEVIELLVGKGDKMQKLEDEENLAIHVSNHGPTIAFRQKGTW